VKVRINNLQKILKIRVRNLNVLTKEICSILGFRGIISVVLTDNKKIKLLNKKYFRRSRPTDVLSFNLQDSFDPLDIAGEIIISAEKAVENSKTFSNDIKNELLLYVIHGLLHLAGFKDSTNSEKEIMRKKEKRLLSHLCKKETHLIDSFID